MLELQLKKEYSVFIEEYESLNHMEEIPEENLAQSLYYLPHNTGTKSDNLTIKTQVVIDTFATTTSGLSLNDIIIQNPTLHNELYLILIRFWFHLIVLIADVEKMYQQVRVSHENSNLQCLVSLSVISTSSVETLSIDNCDL